MIDPVLQRLLGEALDGTVVQGLVHESGVAPRIKEYDDSIYLKFLDRGMSLLFSKADRKLWSIFLYASGHEGFSQYSHEVMRGLSFELSRDQIHQFLGDPDKMGGGEFSPELGSITGTYDKYLGTDFDINITYKEDGHPLLIWIGRMFPLD